MTPKKESKGGIRAYVESAMDEFGKITWPTKEQAALLTAITVAVTLAFAVFIGVTDLGFSELYKVLLDTIQL
jgi:preprotein translocase SecE subunit